MSSTYASHPDVSRVPALDGLRGIAILMVVVYHFYGGAGFLVERSGRAFENDLSKVIDFGWAGVDLFFVLSGFLITGILLQAKTQTRGAPGGFFRNFYARRVLRIFPVYYGFLFFLIAILPIFLRDNPDLAILRENQLWYWLYALNIFVAFDPQNLGFYGNGHLWSLAVEEQFYLIWPLVVLVTPRRMLIAVCAACVVGAFLFRVMIVNGAFPDLDNVFAASVLLPARIDSLAIGGLLAAVAQSPGGLARFKGVGYAAFGVTAAAILAMFAWRDGFILFDERVQTVGFTLTAFCGASALLVVVTSDAASPVGRALSMPVLRMFGRYSYAMYVFHLQIGLVMISRLDGYSWPLVMGSEIPMRLAFTAIALTLTMVLAWLSWHLMERHFLRLKRYFEYEDSAQVQVSEATGKPAPVEARGRP